jgi:TubC N-terminal docking domain
VTTAELVAAVQAKGISLVVNGDKLQCKGKDSALTPELLGELREHKREIMLMLAKMCFCVPPMRAAVIDSPACQHCGIACWCSTCGGCRWCSFEVKWRDFLGPRYRRT